MAVPIRLAVATVTCDGRLVSSTLATVAAPLICTLPVSLAGAFCMRPSQREQGLRQMRCDKSKWPKNRHLGSHSVPFGDVAGLRLKTNPRLENQTDEPVGASPNLASFL